MDIPLTAVLRRAVIFLGATALILLITTAGPDILALLEGKVDTNDPIFSREVLEYEFNEDGTVTYDYVADSLPALLDPKEDLTRRTESSYTKYLGTNEKGEELYELIAYSDDTYVKRDGVWFARETGTTDRTTFAAARQSNPLAGLFWERAVAVDIYAGAGDGDVSHTANLWGTVRSAVTGSTASPTGTTALVRTHFDGLNYHIARSFLPFDTSSIPSGSTVTSASLNIYVTAKTNTDNDGNDFVTVVDQIQNAVTTLTTADFDATSFGGTEGVSTGERKDITSVSTGSYLSFALNSTGIGWIGDASTGRSCRSFGFLQSCFGLLEGHDQLNNSPGSENSITFSTSEATGTSQDPYLSVTYSTSSSLSKPPNNLGLVGYWNFNEATSTTATDFSGRGNHGTLAAGGALPAWGLGKRGSALTFDGGDYVSVPDSNNSLDLTSNATISFWMKPSNVSSNDQNVLGKGNETALERNFYVFQFSDEIYFGFYNGGHQEENSTNMNLEVGVWQHVVITYDDAANSIVMYKDGVAVSDNGGASSFSMVADNRTFYIGAAIDELTLPFQGSLDEVRIYNRTLTGSEVATLYGSGAIRIAAGTKALEAGSTLGSGLVGHWTFDGRDVVWSSATAGTAIDATGNGRNGTLFGGISRTSSVSIGKIGQALAFDGAPGGNPDGQYVSVSDAAAFDITSDITLAAWVRPRALNGVDGIITKNDNLTWSYDLYLNGSNQLGFDVNGVNAGNSTGTLSDTNWNHVAATRSGSTITFYINGVAAGTATNGTAFNVSTAPVSIGTFSVESPCGSGCFDGSIDDARIYNRALTATEIAQLAKLGQAKIAP